VEKGYFEEEEDSPQNRVNRFGQYGGQPSMIWLREVIQNAYDSDASEVNLSVEGRGDGLKLVKFSDNGVGMTKEILQKKFLKMGGTGKGDRESGDSMGGFGEAKKVILLAWQAWRVTTKVAGNAFCTVAESVDGGRNYIIKNAPASLISDQSGTTVEIVTWNSERYTVNSEHFRIIVSKCNLPNIRFTLSVSAGRTGSKSLEPTAHEHPTTNKIEAGFTFNQNAKATLKDSKGRDAAKVYIRKSTSTGGSRIFYRVKGLWLWDNYFSITKEDNKESKVSMDIIVEFVVKTTTILTDNRDSVADKVLRDAVQYFLDQAASDPRLFLRGFSKQEKLVYRGSEGGLRYDKSVRVEKAADAVMSSLIEGRIDPKQAVDKIVGAINAASSETEEIKFDAEVSKKMFEHAISSIRFEGEPDRNAVVNAVRMAVDSPDILLYIEEDLQIKGFEIHQKFKPGTMTAAPKEILSLWAEMCRIVFTIRGCQKSFGVGFVFSEEVLGLASGQQKDAGGVTLSSDGFLLFNPYYFDLYNKVKMIDVRDLKQLKRMWSTCIHECTHMIDGSMDHGEKYAIALTENIAHTSNCWGLVKRIAMISSAGAFTKDKFVKDLHVEDYFIDKFEKPKPKDPKTEEYLLAVARELSMRGGQIPLPEEFGVELTYDSLEKIKKMAAKSKDLVDPVNKIIIRSLQAKVEAQKTELSSAREELAKARENFLKDMESRPAQSERQPEIKKSTIDRIATVFKNPRG
jgi:hypothetical protein